MTAFCEIIFEQNPKKVFYTGQSVCGSVHLTLYNEQDVKAINVKINGAVITICHSSNIGKNCLTGDLEVLGKKNEQSLWNRYIVKISYQSKLH